MIEHEDNLLNQRLTWFLLAQAFLFAAFGTVLNASITGIFLGFPAKRFVLFIVSSVGLLNSGATIQPLYIAMERVDELKDEWKKHYNSKDKERVPSICDSLLKLLSSRQRTSTSNSCENKLTEQVQDTLPDVCSIKPNFRCFVVAFPLISGLAWLFLLLFSSCSTINEDNSKNQDTQQSQPQIKSGQTYLIIKQDSNKPLTLKAVKEKINSANSAFQAKMCQKKPKPNPNESKESVLIIAPKGYPSFHLPTDIADSTEAQIKQSSPINFLRLTDNIDKLYDCQ